MSQYLLSVHHDGVTEMPTDEAVIAQMYADVDASTRSSGPRARGSSPAACTRSSPRPRGRHRRRAVVTDGPFAETKEYLGGFWVIEAADLDAALTWAKEGSAACQGKVEVRPFQDA